MLFSQQPSLAKAFIGGGLLALFSHASLALTLTNGNYDRYTFAVEADKSYEINFNQSSCNVSDGINTCCVLLLNHGNSAPLINAYHFSIASKQASPSMLIDSIEDGNVSVAIYAINPNLQCTYDAPTLKATALTNNTLTSGTGIDQLGNSYTEVNGSRVDTADNRYYLRDISRRGSMANVSGNNAGAMSRIAAITTQRVVGYAPANGALLYDFTPAVSNRWQAGFGENDEADAQVNSAKTYDYWLNTLDLNSFDNLGSSMEAFVDLPYPLEDANFCGQTVPAGSLYNAFSSGSSIFFTKKNITDYFSGDFHSVSLSAALDVTAHEWAHSITENAANLNYERESGALNEAFSDWMGVAVEHANGEINWTIGEGVSLLRDISDPTRFGDPDTYEGANWRPSSISDCPSPDICDNDYCGVHSNSGVPNKMFYLLAAGGTHNGVTVSGLGINRAMQIATDAMRFQWTANETFLTARTGMEAAANAYSRNDSIQVSKAWRAVGVGGKSQFELDDEAAAAVPAVSSGGGGGGGGGGCSLNSEAPTGYDPTLWLLMLGSIIYLRRRSTLTPAVIINR